jgi:hypothetical protein
MRTISAFIAGLAISLMFIVLAGMMWGTRRTHIMQVLPQGRVDAWSRASVLIWLAAFGAAAALPVAFVSTIGFRKTWPTKSFILGSAVGILIGCTVDAWCFHAMNSA